MKLRSIAICTIAVALIGAYAQYPDIAITGYPRVVDGDTLAFGSVHVRIFGIDAPESDQTCADDNGARWSCGEVASMALSQQINGKRVSCDRKDTDQYGRVVAICYVESRDIGARMVLQGWAIDYAKYSHGLYAEEERTAHADKRGIWRGNFELPEFWRRQHRERRR